MAEIHNPRVIGDLSLSRAPSQPEHGVRLADLDARVQPLQAFASNITPSGVGIVSNKVYAQSVPANMRLQSAVADTENLRVTVLAQGGLFQAPSVTVNGEAVTNFTSVSENLFTGYVDLVLAESGDITIASAGGASSTVAVTLATEGPVISMATIGALPGTQTEAKAGDVVAVTGIVANDATSIAVANAGAAASGTISTYGANDSGGAGFKTFSGTFIVANRTGAQAVSLTAQNALGTNGDPTNTANTITLNQAVPTIAAITVAYPAGQGALTVGDTAQVTSVVAGANSVSYAFAAAGATADITDPNVYAATKDLLLNSGTYHVANNYTITATKASNGAVATRQGIVRIAETAATATIAILGTPARLRTSAAGETYTLRVTPNQLLSGNPDITLEQGTFTGAWSFSGGVYSRTFTLDDTAARGVADVTGTLTNLGLTGSAANGTFTVGGLVERTITFDAFARLMPLNALVADFTKTRARYSGQGTDLARRSDTTDVVAAFTLTDEFGVFNANGTHLFLSDAAFAGANTSGTLQVLFEETI